MHPLRGIILTTLALLSAGFVEAQQLSLTVSDGRVTVDARDMPVQQVLAEWARLGGFTVVGSERISGPPITLMLDAVPERQAFDILLRDVSGYLLAARPNGNGAPGSSAFDRVLILPVSAAPAVAPRAAFAPPTAGDARGARPAALSAEPPEREEVEPVEDVVQQAPTPVSTTPGRVTNTPSGASTSSPMPSFPAPLGSGRPGDLAPVTPSNPFGPNTTQPTTAPRIPASGQQPPR